MGRDNQPEDLTSEILDEQGLPKPVDQADGQPSRKRRYPLSPGELVSPEPHQDEDRAAAWLLYLEAVRKHAPEGYEAARQAHLQADLIGPLPLDDEEEPPEYDPAEERRRAHLRRVKTYMNRQERRRRAQGFIDRKDRLRWNPQVFEVLALYEIRRLSEEEIAATLHLKSKQHVSGMIRKGAAVLGMTPRKGLPGIKKSRRTG
jgi:hypothetical protein